MGSIKSFFRIAEFVGHEALTSMARSLWMSWLVIMTITVSLSILGGFLMLVQDLKDLSGTVGAQFPIMVFLSDDASPKGVEETVRAIAGVKDVTLITKDQAWDQMQQDFRQKMTFEGMLEKNPLPDTLKIQVSDASQTPAIAEQVRKLIGVEDVNFGSEMLKKINEFAAFLRTAGLSISGILGIASLAIIMNTIRLAVMAKRREIEIMHLVGASNAFIAWPFLIEGMLFGLFAAILTGLVLFGWRYFTFMKWQEFFPFVPMQLNYVSTLQVLVSLALIGMALGAFGSALSVNKHLRQALAD